MHIMKLNNGEVARRLGYHNAACKWYPMIIIQIVAIITQNVMRHRVRRHFVRQGVVSLDIRPEPKLCMMHSSINWVARRIDVFWLKYTLHHSALSIIAECIPYCTSMRHEPPAYLFEHARSSGFWRCAASKKRNSAGSDIHENHWGVLLDAVGNFGRQSLSRPPQPHYRRGVRHCSIMLLNCHARNSTSPLP